MPEKTAKTLASLRLIAILEGISYLVLAFVAMPMKYFLNDASLIRPTGMLHGWLFILYVLLILLAHFQLRWGFRITAINLILSLVPFGTFYAERKYFRSAAKKP